METFNDQILDSPSKNSYIGSYYQPPDRVLPVSRQLDFSGKPSVTLDRETTSHQVPKTNSNIDGKDVVIALKNLQEKIRRLEQERVQAEGSYQQFHYEIQKKQHHIKQSYTCEPTVSVETDNSGRNGQELDSKLQSAEARCKILEKQLDYMKKMVENTKRQSETLNQNQQFNSPIPQIQQDKLEKLESECLKLSKTQTAAERKLAILEQKLQQEEQERKCIQEKANELQREFNISLQLSMATSEEKTPNKTKKTIKKTPTKSEPASPNNLRGKKMPFVAGTSLSPSHSVHANVQSILHMMKHHQPQLCERVSSMQRSCCGAKKSLQKSPTSTGVRRNFSSSRQEDQSLGSLSDLLLALQDELGQMSFEQQELLRQINSTQNLEEKQDLRKELEKLVARMEEKGGQISKLRKHQQTAQKLTQGAEEHTSKKLSGIKPPAPSPVKAKQKGKKSVTINNNLQLLRETKKFRNGLKQDDVFWET
ncbi:centrosomal protein CEP57L1 [Cynoglossus semilaevis]|uniref:Centrosomal protein 57kDa-like protein 1 n=1 Tax=Cynoglossus semilaevis TaxID=244447 RepID=A0A3P8WLR0_CYNSE|nr:centrosomal protein CEP57L1 [Cynoglossus semilaevis]